MSDIETSHPMAAWNAKSFGHFCCIDKMIRYANENKLWTPLLHPDGVLREMDWAWEECDCHIA